MVGFNAKNKDDIKSSYLCPGCTLILREPVQLVCGHRQCKGCIEAIQGELIKCLECSDEKPKNKIMPDRGFRNDMKVLPIICSLCQWNGLFQDYEKHLNGDHAELTCEDCRQLFYSRATLDEHKQKNCIKNRPERVLTDNGCSILICRNEPLDDNSSTIHQSTLSNPPNHMEHNASHSPNEHLSETEIDIGRTVPTQAPVPANEHDDTDFDELDNMIHILGAYLQILNEDVERLHHYRDQVQDMLLTVIERYAELRLSYIEQNSLIDAARINQEILSLELASLQQRFHDDQRASYDGMTIWKITDVSQKMANARSKRPASIYSHPFYSSPAGYKMCARLFLNGDETVEGTHMSVNFVLMRGLYDPILSFPFAFKVIFCLYDQSSEKQHRIHLFLPRTIPTCAQQPRCAMNIDSGIPKFIPLSSLSRKLNSYVQDDTMFINIRVVPVDMPDTVILYALSLNPGLPIHVQQEMIQQEIVRRAQQISTSSENHSTLPLVPSRSFVLASSPDVAHVETGVEDSGDHNDH